MIYLPGHPSTTRYVQQLNLVAGLVGRPTTLYLTAQHWGWVMAELEAQYKDALMDPTRPGPWANPKKPLQFGPLKVVNAGTDDERAVNRMNHDTPGAIDFVERRDRLRVA